MNLFGHLFMFSSMVHKTSLLILVLGSTSYAQTSTEFIASFSNPLFITAPPDDTGRLFITEKGHGGTASIRIYDLTNQVTVAAPYLTINGLTTSGERGLLGLNKII